MAELPSSFQSKRRNPTIVAAIWLLGVIAFLELAFAGVFYAPVLMKGLRANQTDSTSATTAATPAPPPIQAGQSIETPLNRPLENSPVKGTMGKDAATSEIPSQTAESDSSIQSGGTLGIVSAKLDGTDEGSRKLVITIKANPKVPIDVPQVKVQVYFYDSNGTDISPSKAQVTSSWTSPPVDWKDGEPELLEVRYLPDSADSEIKFAGYVVAIYYKGDLQDYRAEPSRLTKLFPLKYFIGTDE